MNSAISESKITRAVRSSDGRTWIVALELAWWDCLDWMVDYRGERVAEIADYCLRFLEEHPGDTFPDVFAYYLHCYMRDHRHEFFGLANQNRPEEERA